MLMLTCPTVIVACTWCDGEQEVPGNVQEIICRHCHLITVLAEPTVRAPEVRQAARTMVDARRLLSGLPFI
jgi:hypothetical protein